MRETSLINAGGDLFVNSTALALVCEARKVWSSCFPNSSIFVLFEMVFYGGLLFVWLGSFDGVYIWRRGIRINPF